MRIHAAVALTIGYAALVGCSETPLRAPGPVTVIAAPTAAPSSSAIASASATPAAPTDSASAPPSAEPPPNNADRQPGEIACGRATCKVGKEQCCPAKGACDVIRQGDASACEVGNSIQCDTRDDCGKGESCCWLYGDPAAVTMCMSAPCPATQACRSTSGCPEGFTCKPDDDPNDPGTCAFAKPRTPCSKAACSGATPVCRWNSDLGRGACVDGTKTERADEERDVHCSSRADCGGESCCGSGGQTWCGACVNNNVVCKTKADCPGQLGGGQKLTGCVAVNGDDWAPWLKVCEYGE